MLAALHDKGYCVIPDVIPGHLCDQYRAEYESWLSQFKDEKPVVWHGIIRTYSIAHFETTWKIRLATRFVFEEIWNTKKLLTSFDRASLSPPPKKGSLDFNKAGENWFHLDQTAQRVGLHAYQGALYLEETTEADYCFRILSGSLSLFEEFFKNFPRGSPIFRYLSKEEIEWYKAQGCKETKIPVPKGGMVLWDSRLVHDNVKPERGRQHSDRGRYVTFVCMTPARWGREEDLAKKKDAYEKLLMTGHWASQGVRVFEREEAKHDVEIFVPETLPEVAQTTEVRLLAGIDEYDFSDGKPNGPDWDPVWHEI